MSNTQKSTCIYGKYYVQPFNSFCWITNPSIQTYQRHQCEGNNAAHTIKSNISFKFSQISTVVPDQNMITSPAAYDFSRTKRTNTKNELVQTAKIRIDLTRHWRFHISICNTWSKKFQMIWFREMEQKINKKKRKKKLESDQEHSIIN